MKGKERFSRSLISTIGKFLIFAVFWIYFLYLEYDHIPIRLQDVTFGGILLYYMLKADCHFRFDDEDKWIDDAEHQLPPLKS